MKTKKFKLYVRIITSAAIILLLLPSANAQRRQANDLQQNRRSSAVNPTINSTRQVYEPISTRNNNQIIQDRDVKGSNKTNRIISENELNQNKYIPNFSNLNKYNNRNKPVKNNNSFWNRNWEKYFWNNNS